MEKLYQKQEFEQSNLNRLKGDFDKLTAEKEEVIEARTNTEKEIGIKASDFAVLHSHSSGSLRFQGDRRR